MLGIMQYCQKLYNLGLTETGEIKIKVTNKNIKLGQLLVQDQHMV